MKAKLGLILISVCILVLTSCGMHTDASFYVENDGNVKLDITAGLEKTEDINDLQDFGVPEELLGLTEYIEYNYNGTDYAGLHIVTDMDALNQSDNITAAFSEAGLRLYEDNGKYYLDTKVEEVTDDYNELAGKITVRVAGTLVESSGFVREADGASVTLYLDNIQTSSATWEINKTMYDRLQKHISVSSSSDSEFDDFLMIYEDVPNDSDGEALFYMYQNGIMNGVTETSMEPGKNLTREQAVTMLNRYVSSNEVNELYMDLQFADVEQDRWSQPMLAWAYGAGILQGVGTTAEGKVIIDPEGDLTHEQLFTMLGRALGLNAEEDMEDREVVRKLVSEKFADWSISYTYKLVTEGKIPVFDKLYPQEVSTRVYFAVILSNIV